MSTPALGGLLSMLASIPDNRGRQGRRHPLAALLAATVCGILSGARGCTPIAHWISLQEPAFWHALGFYRKPPTKNCYRSAWLGIDPHRLEKVLGQWIDQLFPEATNALQAIAMDGKTLCDTLQPHGQSIHLLSLYARSCHRRRTETDANASHNERT